MSSRKVVVQRHRCLFIGWLTYSILLGIFAFHSSIISEWYPYEGFWMYAIQDSKILNWKETLAWHSFGPVVTWWCWAFSLFPTNLIGLRLTQWLIGTTSLTLVHELLSQLVLPNGVQRGVKHEWATATGVVTISLNPYLFPALVLFSPMGLVVLLISLNLLAAVKIIDGNCSRSWQFSQCLGMLLLALTHHWGLLFNLCLVAGLCFYLPRLYRWRVVAATFSSGVLVPLLLSGFWFTNVNNHYFGVLVSTDLLKLIDSLAEAVVPADGLSFELFIAIGLLTLTRTIWILVGESNRTQKMLATVFLFFCCTIVAYQLATSERVVHHYLRAPFSILGSLIVAGMISTRSAPPVALFLLTLLLACPDTWFNSDQKRFREVAFTLNEKCEKGYVPVFTGSPSFFWLYPFLSNKVKDESLVVVESAGGYADAFEGHGLLPTSKTVNGSFAVHRPDGLDCNFVVLETEINQGLAFDQDSRWSRSVETYFVSRRQPIGKIFVSVISYPDRPQKEGDFQSP